MNEPVRAHASGFVHSRLLLRQTEYLIGVTTATNTASKDVSTEIGKIWSGWDFEIRDEPSEQGARPRKAARLSSPQYQRRVRRHAFYEEAGYGGKHLVQMVENAHAYMVGLLKNPQQQHRAYVPTRPKW